MTHTYTSPLRPLDIGHAARLASVAIDWDATEIGAWHRDAVYAFQSPLPRELVEQLQLDTIEVLPADHFGADAGYTIPRAAGSDSISIALQRLAGPATGGGYWYVEDDSDESDEVDVGQGIRLDFADDNYPEQITITITR